MKKRHGSVSYTLHSAAIALVGIVLLSIFLTHFQSQNALERQRDNLQLKLDIAVRRMAQNAADHDTD